MENKDFELMLKEVMAARLLLDDVSKRLHKQECDCMRDVGILLMFLSGFPLILCEKALDAAENNECPYEACDGYLNAAEANVSQALSILKRMETEK